MMDKRMAAFRMGDSLIKPKSKKMKNLGPSLTHVLMFVLTAAIMTCVVVFIGLIVGGVVTGGRGPRGYNGTAGPPGINGTQGPPGQNGVCEGGGNGTSSVEWFSVAMNSNISSSDFEFNVTDWTSTVDTLLFPGVDPDSLFIDLTFNTFVDGLYTINVPGFYQLKMTQYCCDDINFYVSVSGFGDYQQNELIPLYLSAGTVLTFFATGPSVPFYVDMAADSVYAVTWSVQKVASASCAEGVPGPPGLPGSCSCGNAAESFSVALETSFLVPFANTLEPIVGWTDTSTLPDIPAGLLFQNLDTGSLDLAAGVFTVGVPGVYYISYSQNGLAEFTTFYLQMMVNGVASVVSPYTDGAIYSALLSLDTGDTVQIAAINSNDGEILPAINTLQSFSALAPNNQTYNIVWRMFLVSTASTSTVSGPEVFSLAYDGGLTITTPDVVVPLFSWTATVETLSFPDVSPRYLFASLTQNTFNLSSGVYTVNAPGVYSISYSQYSGTGVSFQLLINGVGGSMTGAGSSFFTGNFNLEAGDVLQIGGLVDVDDVPITVNSSTTVYGRQAYALVWSMEKK